MGMCGFLSSSSCSCATKTVEKVREVVKEVPRVEYREVPFGNPNPKNFRVQRSQTVDKHLVVEIFYPDCKNYEGKKVLVYKNMSLERLMSYKTIDPHFCNQVGCVSPVARFEPTEFGWSLAIRCCEEMKYKEEKVFRDKLNK